jgi:hypothetical protein
MSLESVIFSFNMAVKLRAGNSSSKVLCYLISKVNYKFYASILKGI